MSSSAPIYVAVVDDDESLCRSLGRLLRASGFQPIIYASAENFLRDTKKPKFDCLILDIQLGACMSGVELQRHLAAAGETTPVIFITAHDDLEIRAEAESAGCAAYFSKTHSGEEVVKTIRQLVS
jgi:FixJ family two-component response regulator